MIYCPSLIRAGRQAPGVCYRLWTESTHRGMQESTRPEILTGDLAPLALQLAAWGCPSGAGLRWVDAPPPQQLLAGRQLLGDLGAVDAGGGITEHGMLGPLAPGDHDLGRGI